MIDWAVGMLRAGKTLRFLWAGETVRYDGVCRGGDSNSDDIVRLLNATMVSM